MFNKLRPAFWGVFLAYVFLVAFLSLTPDGPALAQGGDKWAHYGAYMVMALLGLPLPAKRASRLRMFVFVMTLGAVLEWLQGFSPVRTPDVWDGVANVAGALVGTFVWLGAGKFLSERIGRHPVE